ncbi:hypothetical protein KIW84_063788 [Lathyrus oleraceus]|uniref:Uncharacterized protein n=1 Tax=Pisum sativum TaxID=3888 RepID=A0A9D5A863_PEA|nr:hypothetical protein KIW84_063788 [Pisum sativum]
MNASANLASQTYFRGNKFGTQGNWRGSNFRGGRGRGRSKSTCQVCNKIGHTAVQCFYRYDKSYTCSNHYAENNKQENHSAFISSPYHGQDYEWYFDSGASNHVTHQNEKLQDLSESNGTTTSHIIEPSKSDVNHQEQDLAVNKDQPVLSEISVTADEATPYTNEAPTTTGPTQETGSVENTSEDNQHVQQIRTRNKAGIYKPKLPYI